MKVGILTFQNANNYGAALQAFALCSTVRKLGYNAELIDYKNPSVTEYENPRLPHLSETITNPVGSVFRLATAKAFSCRKKTFDSFNEKYELIGPPIENQVDIEREYDVVIVGSDQVWNPVITGGDMTYFLSQVGSSRTRKMAYAASFGYESFPSDLAKQCGEALIDFDCIGVRETEGSILAKTLAGADSSVVLDPTLLFQKTDWETVIASGSIRESILELAEQDQGYLFVYIAAERSKTISFAKRVAKQRNLNIVLISGYRGLPFIRCGKDVSFASLEEFLFLMQHASLVVTSSFHGYALSLALEKDVYFSLVNGGNTKNSRLLSLARITQTEDREIADRVALCPIDYSAVSRRIEAERQRSLSFLQYGLEKCTAVQRGIQA